MIKDFIQYDEENAYHMLFLGICVTLRDIYTISSNIETGHGHSDILMNRKQPGSPISS